MARESSPAFQFYAKDFLTDGNVAAMSLEERGAYITLLCLCWLECSLPTDTRRLAQMVGSTHKAFLRLWPSMRECFTEQDNRLIQGRLEKERTKQDEYRQRQSVAGKASATARQPKGNHGFNQRSTNAQPDRQPKLNSSSPSPKEQEQKLEREIRPLRTGPRTGLLKPNGNVAFQGPKLFMPWDVYRKLSQLRNNNNADSELRSLFDRVSAEWSEGGQHANDEPGANMFRFWDARYEEQWPPTQTAKVEAKPTSSPAAEARMRALLDGGRGR